MMVPANAARRCGNKFGDNYDTGISGRPPNMKRISVVSVVFLFTLAAAPCFAQQSQPLSSLAAAQTKKQDQRRQLTHGEVVQFVHTVQTESANWKETISSVDPSAFRFNLKLMASVEKEKKALLLALGEIETLSLSASEKNAATDLGAEFAVHTFLDQIACGAGDLSATLAYNSIDGFAKANELLQVQREALKADETLFKEIVNRITNIARSEKSEGCPQE
jgi:hypothetical protein